MNKRIKKLWLKALRSGKYLQGQRQLRTPAEGDRPAEYCCLGVLTDLYLAAHGQEWTAGLETEGELPRRVAEWANLSDPNPDCGKSKGEICTLAEHNDGDFASPKSFKQIANLIERHL